MSPLPPTISADAFESFRARQRRRWFAAFAALLVVAVAAALGLAAAGSLVAGIITAIVIVLIGYELLRRWNRRCWVTRFPELADLRFRWRTDER